MDLCSGMLKGAWKEWAWKEKQVRKQVKTSESKQTKRPQKLKYKEPKFSSSKKKSIIVKCGNWKEKRQKLWSNKKKVRTVRREKHEAEVQMLEDNLTHLSEDAGEAETEEGAGEHLPGAEEAVHQIL